MIILFRAWTANTCRRTCFLQITRSQFWPSVQTLQNQLLSWIERLRNDKLITWTAIFFSRPCLGTFFIKRKTWTTISNINCIYSLLLLKFHLYVVFVTHCDKKDKNTGTLALGRENSKACIMQNQCACQSDLSGVMEPSGEYTRPVKKEEEIGWLYHRKLEPQYIYSSLYLEAQYTVVPFCRFDLWKWHVY